ncbi:MAG: sigma-54-dependent Fis family transcriptional regulator [Candidatus Rokubacteria bacterium]|nr:sigma-54-dependent Fis family transcriptional regulator [Candidatus Rokubacteria bacterium]
MPTVLIVDDDAGVRSVVAELLLQEKIDVAEAADGRTGLDRALAERPSLVILDIGMPGLDGMTVLRRLKSQAPEMPVMMLTAYGDLGTAVEAMRLGAWDYLAKPFDNEDLLLHVQRALDWQRLSAEVQSLKEELAGGGALRALLGASREMHDVVARIRQVAGSRLTVLIEGETGTGKELVARAIHAESPRRAGPFIAVDCGAIAETLVESELFGHEKGAFTGADRRKDGHFQIADGGTLFLDEVVNLPPATQAKLLRVLQEREVWPVGAKAPTPVDVRIVAACNVALEPQVQAGRFRQDLFYRLNEFAIQLPPLRARRTDILPLARHFLAEAAMELKRPVHRVSPAAEDRLLGHAWPGNVRELRNVVRRAVLLAVNVVEPEHLELGGAAARAATGHDTGGPAAVETLKDAREHAIAEAERRAIRRALDAAHGNKAEAARLLQVDYKTLHTKVKQYAIRPDFLGA